MAERKRASKKKIALIIFISVLLILLGLGFLGSSIVGSYLDKINRVDGSDASTADGTTIKDLESQYGMMDGDLINILLVGEDKHDEWENGRSDSMILCSINPETEQVAMISFLRDLYVQIPGYYDNRLNAAYYNGGFDLLCSTLNKNFGVTIDGCVAVDFEQFITGMDAIGGVDIELTAAEAYVVGNGAVEGMNHLSGKQALAYARIRKLDSDFGRTERQRKVLQAAVEQCRDLSLKELLALADQVLPSVTTNMSDKEILSLVKNCFPMLDSMEMTSYYIPAEGTYTNARINGMAVLVPDLEANRALLRTEYLPMTEEQREEALKEAEKYAAENPQTAQQEQNWQQNAAGYAVQPDTYTESPVEEPIAEETMDPDEDVQVAYEQSGSEWINYQEADTGEDEEQRTGDAQLNQDESRAKGWRDSQLNNAD